MKDGGDLLKKQYLSIALAYTGVIVGAGLSSGQDLLQYFLSFGILGIIGVILMGALNVIFGKIIITMGCYYQSDNHEEVLSKIAHPFINKIIDFTLIISSFIMGFVMVAGAGANLKQQFGIPAWEGAAFCSVLIIIISFLDFNKITGVLGIFTPIIVIMILIITAYTFIGKSYDFSELDTVARTIKPAIPNVWLSVVNYFALCLMTGVGMAFVLGGSVVRIGVAEKGGVVGGAIIGIIVICTSMTLFANVDKVKDAEIPMLQIIGTTHPVFSLIYAIVIFALIFNTAFSLYYATARRFAGGNNKKLRIILIGIVISGYICSFGGFKTLVSYMYPILGYMGIVLTVVLLIAWFKERKNIIIEKFIRRKMIRILFKKHDDNKEFTSKDKKVFHELGEASIADTETLKEDIKSYTQDVADNTKDLQYYADKHLRVEPGSLKDIEKK